MTSNMYREQILDLYKNPNNFGDLPNFTHEYHEFNLLCGDEIIVQLIIKNNKIKDVKFQGHGCAISIASASLLTDKIKGMKINEVKNMNFEDIKKLLGIDITYQRIKCATLAQEAVKRAIVKEK